MKLNKKNNKNFFVKFLKKNILIKYKNNHYNLILYYIN